MPANHADAGREIFAQFFPQPAQSGDGPSNVSLAARSLAKLAGYVGLSFVLAGRDIICKVAPTLLSESTFGKGDWFRATLSACLSVSSTLSLFPRCSSTPSRQLCPRSAIWSEQEVPLRTNRTGGEGCLRMGRGWDHDVAEGFPSEVLYLKSHSRLRSYPRDYRAHLDLGNVYSSQGQYEKASEADHQSLGLAPDNSAPYTDLGNSLLALQRFDEARQTIQQAQGWSEKDLALSGVRLSLLDLCLAVVGH
jgi:tetratricopeptide (TPR) repeat protein